MVANITTATNSRTQLIVRGASILKVGKKNKVRSARTGSTPPIIDTKVTEEKERAYTNKI
jgi:hypothetical protein